MGRGRRLPLGDQCVFPCDDFDKAEGVWYEYIKKSSQIEAFAGLEPIDAKAILRCLSKSTPKPPIDKSAYKKSHGNLSTRTPLTAFVLHAPVVCIGGGFSCHVGRTGRPQLAVPKRDNTLKTSVYRIISWSLEW